VQGFVHAEWKNGQRACLLRLDAYGLIFNGWPWAMVC
jgi:hypothetical protein